MTAPSDPAVPAQRDSERVERIKTSIPLARAALHRFCQEPGFRIHMSVPVRDDDEDMVISDCISGCDWLLTQLAARDEEVARLMGALASLESWTHEHGASLSPQWGTPDTYGEGMRAAKAFIRSMLAALRSQNGEGSKPAAGAEPAEGEGEA